MQLRLTLLLIIVFSSSCASVPERYEVTNCPSQIPEVFTFEGRPAPAPVICHRWWPMPILFNKGSCEVRLEAAMYLDELAKAMKHSQDRVRLVGHTCDLGSQEVNLRIGLLRAEAAKRYLVGQGIAADQIEVATKGEAEPSVSNDSEVRRKLNRRVETVLIPALRLEEPVL